MVTGLHYRLNILRMSAPLLWRGLPHGVNPHADVDRRLTRTRITTVFDVGANKGQTASVLRRWYPRAIIHCFEPAPATFTLLQLNLSQLGGIRVYPLGLSNRVGEIPLVIESDNTRSHVSKTASDTGAGTVMIQLETLDTFCDRHAIASIDYLKIDTEGHDLAVLEGAATLLQESRIAIVEVEASMNPDNRFHVSAEALTQTLVTRGYRLFGVYEQTLEWPTADAYLRRANLVFVSPDTITQNRWRG